MNGQNRKEYSMKILSVNNYQSQNQTRQNVNFKEKNPAKAAGQVLTTLEYLIKNGHAPQIPVRGVTAPLPQGTTIYGTSKSGTVIWP